MGPRLGRVEYQSVNLALFNHQPSFNGATLRTRGIQKCGGNFIRFSTCFNGATLRTRGIPFLAAKTLGVMQTLQWGHA